MSGELVTLDSRKTVLTFLIALVLVSGLNDWYMWALVHGRVPEYGQAFGRHAEVVIMWGPAIAAFAACVIRRRSMKDFGWNWGPRSFRMMGMLIPLGYSAAIYAVCWEFRIAPFDWASAQRITGEMGLGHSSPSLGMVAFTGYSLTFGMVNAMALGLGEEIGWRGLLFPEMANFMGLRKAAVASGLIWSVWHFPYILVGDLARPGNPIPLGFRIACFVASVTSIGVISGWLRWRSGSLWPSIILHAAHNVFMLEVLDPATLHQGRAAKLAVGEYGLGLVMLTVPLAIYLLARQFQSPSSSPQVSHG